MEIYANAHLLRLYQNDKCDAEPLLRKIALKGGMQETDFPIFRKFADRVVKLGDYAAEVNCKLYVDAEQTFIQGAIESFG